MVKPWFRHVNGFLRSSVDNQSDDAKTGPVHIPSGDSLQIDKTQQEVQKVVHRMMLATKNQSKRYLSKRKRTMQFKS